MLINAKYFRELKNYSMDYVATELEISIKKYYKMENGKSDIKMSELNKLAKILGVHSYQLIK